MRRARGAGASCWLALSGPARRARAERRRPRAASSRRWRAATRRRRPRSCARAPTRTRPTARAGRACTRPRTRATSRSPGPSSRRAPTRTCARARAGRRSTSPRGAGAWSSRGCCGSTARRARASRSATRCASGPGGGDGYCAVVEAADPIRYRLRVSRVVGCAAGCEPEPSCSGGQVVGAGRPRRGRRPVGARLLPHPHGGPVTAGDAALARRRAAPPLRRSLVAALRRRLAGALRRPTPTATPPPGGAGFTYNGVTHVSWWHDEYGTPAASDSRRALAATGAGWGGLLTTWYMERKDSNDIRPVAEPLERRRRGAPRPSTRCTRSG